MNEIYFYSSFFMLYDSLKKQFTNYKNVLNNFGTISCCIIVYDFIQNVLLITVVVSYEYGSKSGFAGGERQFCFHSFSQDAGGAVTMGKYAVFNEITFLHIVNMQGQAGRRESNANAKNTYIVYIQHFCSMFLLSVLELVAAPARTQLAMTFLECLSSSSVTLNLLHMHIQYLKTSKLQNYGFNVVMQQQQYMYVMYIVDMYFICFCCGFSFQLVGGKTRECCCCLWGVVETWWFFFLCSGNVL